MSVDTSRENCERVAEKIGEYPHDFHNSARNLILALRDELDTTLKSLTTSQDTTREQTIAAEANRVTAEHWRERAERAEAERDAARVDAERYRTQRNELKHFLNLAHASRTRAERDHWMDEGSRRTVEHDALDARGAK